MRHSFLLTWNDIRKAFNYCRILLFCHIEYTYCNQRRWAVGCCKAMLHGLFKCQELQQAFHWHGWPQLSHVQGHWEPSSDAFFIPENGVHERVRRHCDWWLFRLAARTWVGGLHWLLIGSWSWPVNCDLRHSSRWAVGLRMCVSFAIAFKETDSGVDWWHEEYPCGRRGVRKA